MLADLELRSPLLGAAVLAALAGLVLLWRLPPRGVLVGSVTFFAGLPLGPCARARRAVRVLSAAGLFLLAVAAARPQQRWQRMEEEPERRAFVLVLDVSSSMGRIDPGEDRSRLSWAREVLVAFLSQRTDDELALVTFARYPEVRSPLTTDRAALAELLSQVTPVPGRSDADGTAIGAALAEAAELLASAPPRSRRIILLTDGKNNQPTLHPYEGAFLCAQASVRVHAVSLQPPASLAGSDGVDVLDEIARATAGQHWVAPDAAAWKEVFERIHAGEGMAHLQVPRTRYADLFPWFAAPALGLLLAALVLESLRARVWFAPEREVP